MSKPKGTAKEGPPRPKAKGGNGSAVFTMGLIVLGIAVGLGISQLEPVKELLGMVSSTSPSATSVKTAASTETTTTSTTTKKSDSSGSDHKPRNVKFINNHDVDINLYWISHSGESQLMARLKPGTDMAFNTYVGQEWTMHKADPSEFIQKIVIGSNTLDVASKHLSEFHREYERRTGRTWINTVRGPLKGYVPPTVELGHKQTVTLSPAFYELGKELPAQDSTVDIVLETTAIRPKIFYIEQFLSSDEVDHFLNVTFEHYELKRSGVKDTGEIIDSRTSRNTWIDCDRDPIITAVSRRAYALLKKEFDPNNWKSVSESFQLLRYELGQEYQEHYDYFPPAEYPNNKHVQAGNNRYANIFIYLADVEEGGETMFPRAGGVYANNACTNDEAYKVPPKKGAAALFFSMLEDGNLDFDALHGGCPVKKGTKFASNMWFWDEFREP